jgi:aminoglycoside phosphotransferase (APT) family kinase protein
VAAADRPAPAPLARILAAELGLDGVTIASIEPLFGGAVRRHWRLVVGHVSGDLDLVLRADGATPLGMGLDLTDEFALLQALHAAGLAVPPPVLASSDLAVIGAPFHLTQRLPGSADPAALVAAGRHEALAERLGAELAAVQRITPPALSCLGNPLEDAAASALATMRTRLDALEPRPAAEWALRWLLRHAPSPLPPILCHGDFRTGNYLVEDGRFVALLDWEFAHWGDPDEDIAWFCARGGRDRVLGFAPARLRGVRPPPRFGAPALVGGDGGAALAGHRAASARPLPQTRREFARSRAHRTPRRRMRVRAASLDHGQGCLMRDLPLAADLVALADGVPREDRRREDALVARCHGIAAREQADDAREYDAVRAALIALYGDGDDAALLGCLAAAIRSGHLDRPGPERTHAARLLLQLTVQKLRESNPAFLAGAADIASLV